MRSGKCTIYLWWRLQLRTVAVACSLGAVMSESGGVVTRVGDWVRREWLGWYSVAEQTEPVGVGCSSETCIVGSRSGLLIE
jgi:hypothetical protein